MDVALAALTAGFALYSARGEPSWKLWAVLAAAPLARETGLLLAAGYGVWALGERRWARAAGSAAALVPLAAWSAYIALRSAPDLTSHLGATPFAGIAWRALHPLSYPVTSAWLRNAAALDYLAFLGVVGAMLLALRRRPDPLWTASALFAIALAFVSHPQVWAEAYAFGRVASPLLVLLGMAALRDRWWWGLGPLAMAAPRVLWQLLPQAKAILRG